MSYIAYFIERVDCGIKRTPLNVSSVQGSDWLHTADRSVSMLNLRPSCYQGQLYESAMSILPSSISPVHSVHPPEVRIIKYASGDHELKFRSCRMSGSSQKGKGGTRSTIKAFTPEAVRRCRKSLKATAHIWKAFAHLTYPLELRDSLDGRDVKKHLNTFLNALRRDQPDILYAWVLEFMKNGLPHYHLVFDRFIDKDWLSRTWYRIVGSGLEKHLKAGTKITGIKNPMGAMFYLSEYLSKADQKQIPDTFMNTIGRWWGMSQGLMVQCSMEMVLEYPTPNAARSDTRNLRRARKAFLKSRADITGWKWRGNGYLDSQTPEPIFDRLVDLLQGKPKNLLDYDETLDHSRVPW